MRINHKRELAERLSESDHRAQRAQLVFDHRRAGGQITREFAQELAEQGFATKEGNPLSVSVLHDDYQAFVKNLTVFHRETYQDQQTLQLVRLEGNLEILNEMVQELRDDAEADTANIRPVKTVLVLRELRQTIESISKLTGANAPVEVVVTQRLESEVEMILGILRQGLTDDEFQKVAGCLAKGMGLVQEKARGKELVGVEGVVEEVEVVGMGE
ncbi:hypothetical protein D0962_09420 [Leptolyngbyaceae cyanobacterium CCMR0082]|uniref:Uncharacterized protein n=1 Tax=Adonisia turfae CCMR0082 TaxID=2304604 RepID=A0A6M0S3B3_9CYAN|nr:hypothetical protein [Adonisia turfae]NEZ62999.1 hypothetical protein [Adonisia turfae CCMR0082]